MQTGKDLAETPSKGTRGTIHSVHEFAIEASPTSVWRRFSDVGEYRRWWAWLRAFDATGLTAGDEWRCVVQPPVPYRVCFSVTLCDVEPPSRVRARVDGDVVGDAVLSVEDVSGGSLVTLCCDLAPRSPVLRAVSRLARPVARRGHEAVISSGIRSFLEQTGGTAARCADPNLCT